MQKKEKSPTWERSKGDAVTDQEIIDLVNGLSADPMLQDCIKLIA